jgi:hypothetical protein
MNPLPIDILVHYQDYSNMWMELLIKSDTTLELFTRKLANKLILPEEFFNNHAQIGYIRGAVNARKVPVAVKLPERWRELLNQIAETKLDAARKCKKVDITLPDLSIKIQNLKVFFIFCNVYTYSK